MIALDTNPHAGSARLQRAEAATVACPACGSWGALHGEPCDACGGAGRVAASELKVVLARMRRHGIQSEVPGAFAVALRQASAGLDELLAAHPVGEVGPDRGEPVPPEHGPLADEYGPPGRDGCDFWNIRYAGGTRAA